MWNDTSRSRLQGVDPRLVSIMETVRTRTGIPFQISEGLRELERQTRMVEQGKSQTMNSRHLTGNALDIYIVGEDGQPVWDFEAYRPLGDTFKSVAQEMGYDDAVWGGDWETLRDGVHFQLGGGGHNHLQDVEPPGAMPPPQMSNNALARQNPQIDRLARANALMSLMPERQNNLLDVRSFMNRPFT